MTLIQAMHTDYHALSPDSSLGSAARQMGEIGWTSLPVVEHGRLVGSLDVFDVAMRAIGEPLDLEHGTVGALMRREPLTCRPETTLEDAERLMTNQRETSILITEPDGRLVGFIDLFTVLNALRRSAGAGPEPEWNKRVRGEQV